MNLSHLFKNFYNSEKSGGFLLMGCSLVSLIFANSGWGNSYVGFWETAVFEHNITHWINDGLMAIFFLLIGLELEREVYAGELSKFRQALLPAMGALGGVLIPAIIYLIFNFGTKAQSGAGIPMATDIAFAIGMLSLLGNRVPTSLKIFLTALAIIDDLCAILIIAIFYSSHISWLYLGACMGIFGILLLLNRLNVNRLPPYLIGGVVMWYCMLHSGVHATLSGVLLAFAIPFGDGSQKSISYKLQHILHRPVAFIIIPLFALANTAIAISPHWAKDLLSNEGMGIITGLVLGKPLGIYTFSRVAVWCRWCALPDGLTWRQLLGAGMLGGIGFTMSIFIALLAFNDARMIDVGKIAIIVSSVLASVIGLSFLKLHK
jgi:NhaA family Na+:H+ antiporter